MPVRSGKIVAVPFMSPVESVLIQSCVKKRAILVITNCVGIEITSSRFKDVFRHHFNNRAHVDSGRPILRRWNDEI
jgi:hypothetical protein